jgi:hypothetical protein
MVIGMGQGFSIFEDAVKIIRGSGKFFGRFLIAGRVS